MARGGMVYVKRDVSNEEAPRTFSTEEGSVLAPWIQWAKAKLLNQDLPPPVSKAPSATTKQIAAARSLFGSVLTSAGKREVSDWIQIIEGCSPALGMPWEGASGTRYPEAKQSWLLAGFEDAIPSSGWLEWACASIRLLAKNTSAAEVLLPSRSIIDPWDPSARGVWAYTVLNKWVDSSFLGASQSATFERWTQLVHEIDARTASLPSPLGLPFHWQIAARQAQACLMRKPEVVLFDLGPLPPVHSEIKMAVGKPVQAWAGTSEWLMSRFSRQVLASKRWDAVRWDQVRGVMESDLSSRTPDSHRLLLPFVQDLRASIGSVLVEGLKANDPAHGLLRDGLKTEVDAWCLTMSTPRVARSSRSMRL